MFQVIWELKVKFKEREKFEQFYDAKGDWVNFLGNRQNTRELMCSKVARVTEFFWLSTNGLLKKHLMNL